MKTLAVRLLLRLGMAYAVAEDMLLAADLQAELSIDVTYDLSPLLSKSEKLRSYVIPRKSDSGDNEPSWYENRIDSNQSRVCFNGADDRNGENNTAGMDDEYYYMWSDDRGLYKGKIDPSNFHW